MRKLLKNYLSFSTNERNGIFVFVVLILALLIYPQLIPLFNNSSETDKTSLDTLVKQFELSLTPIHSDTGIQETQQAEQNQLFPFDPNTASLSDFMILGMSNKMAQTIINYRNKGGKFFVKKDLLKIYGMDTILYNSLFPYINIELKTTFVPKAKYTRNEKTREVVEINKADSALFESLPCIGPVLAKRIISYRKRTGGFYTVNQLKEVYGISDSIYNVINPLLAVDSTLLVKINLNTIPADSLAMFPYLNKYQSKAIISYRKTVGKIKNKNELVKNKLIPLEVFNKISPYLNN
jgi:competence protein ComEA